jgi:hypothetical protein
MDCGQTIGTLPIPQDPDLEPEQPPDFTFPTPPAYALPALRQWCYSAASLSGVLRVRHSSSGIEFEYAHHSAALGEFKPNEASSWIGNPRWYSLHNTSEADCGVQFYSQRDAAASTRLERMEGLMILWFCKDRMYIRVE